jgi:hypothetical protein
MILPVPRGRVNVARRMMEIAYVTRRSRRVQIFLFFALELFQELLDVLNLDDSPLAVFAAGEVDFPFLALVVLEVGVGSVAVAMQ